jgi:hypothetical protein
MNPQRNGDPRFRVTYLPRAKDQFGQIVRRAAQLGRLTEITTAARTVQHHLETNPRIFGEPTGELPNARLDVRHAAVGPVIVYYGVHQDLQEVFVSGFRDML